MAYTVAADFDHIHRHYVRLADLALVEGDDEALAYLVHTAAIYYAYSDCGER